MTLLQRLSLLWRRFSPLEEQLLLAVRGALATSVQPTFDAQVAAITRVQRHPQWTEIAFYRIRRGKVDWGGVPLFPREEELPLAEVHFRALGRSYKARLTAIGGHIFDFAITPGPRGAAFTAWEGRREVRLLSDPTDVGAPKPLEALPEAWLQFLAGAGRTLSGWTLHDASEAYRVALDEGEFLVLAEQRGNDFLLYRLEPKPLGFFVQLGHDGSPEPMKGDFRSLLWSQPDS